MKPLRVAIIGGGIAGLSAGFFLRQKCDERVSFTIFEKSSRPGGTIGVTRRDGYIADWGPNGFLDKEPLTLELVEALGLSDQLLRANDKAAHRFVYRNGKLHELALHPLKFLLRGPLSLPGRLRVPLELFASPKTDDADETIHAFASRRLGPEAADYLITPMVTGIFGGDARELSLPACFPAMRQMERQYGSLIKALIRKKKEAKGTGREVSAGPSGKLTTFRGGFYTLVEKLAESLGPHLHCGSEIQEIAREGNEYVVQSAAQFERFDKIILAVPAFAAAMLLDALYKPAAGLLRQIPYCGLTVVCQGYSRAAIRDSVDGFGFLVPPDQGLDILGSIWTSMIFPEQAPPDQVLFRTMLGGSRHPEKVDLPAEQAAGLAHENLARLLGITDKPCFEEVITWKRAIPQYTLNHLERLERLEKNLAESGSIFLAGNAYTGIGLNDVIKRSHEIVQRHFSDISSTN